MPKIKSVKVNFNNGEIIEQDNTVVTVSGMAYVTTDGAFKRVQCSFDKKDCQIEYEPEKPKLLKRPDGSLITFNVENGEELLYIDGYYRVIHIDFDSHYYNVGLRRGLVFELADNGLAEKKGKQLETQDTITNEIHRLNAEQGWKPNWSDFNQRKYYLYFDYHNEKISYDYNYVVQNGETYMCEGTKSIILEKYTKKELKQFLEILD